MVNNKIDNFDFVLNNLCDKIKDGKFLYVELISRIKDNMENRNGELIETIHGYIENGTAFKIYNKEQLLSLKEKIIQYCDENNRRAYISRNPLSQKLIDEAVERLYSRTPKKIKEENTKEKLIFEFNHKFLCDFSGMSEKDDLKYFLIDFDIKDENLWDKKRKILLDNNIKIDKEYISPSGGLHMIISGIKTDALFDKIKRKIIEISNGKHVLLMKYGKMILYSNVHTRGY